MYISHARLHCGSLAGGVLLVIAAALGPVAQFLPWWDVGSPKELFDLTDAPGVVSSIWSFHYKNPPAYVLEPTSREPSNWEEYCAKSPQDDARLAPAGSSGTVGNRTNSSNASESGGEQVSELQQDARPNAEPALPADFVEEVSVPPGTCHLMRVLRMFMMVDFGIGILAVAFFFYFGLRRSSLLGLMAGGVLSMIYASTVCASLLLASMVSMTGLLSGLGTQIAALSMCLGVAGATLAVYAGTKALQEPPARQVVLGGEAEEDSEDETGAYGAAMSQDLEAGQRSFKYGVDPHSRMGKARAAKAREKRKAQKHAKIFGMRRSTTEGSGMEMGTRRQQELEKALAAATPKHLMEILRWDKDMEVPDEILEKAFYEIDVDASGVITIEEFIMAIEHCNLHPARASLEKVVADIDRDNNGDIDLHEFVEFFRWLESALREEARGRSQARICQCAGQLGFVFNVIFIAGAVVTNVRNDSEELPEPGTVKASERELVQTMLRASGVTFVLFFFCVVGIPLLQLSIGKGLKAWKTSAKTSFQEWKANQKKRREQAAGLGAEENKTAGMGAKDGDSDDERSLSVTKQRSDGHRSTKGKKGVRHTLSNGRKTTTRRSHFPEAAEHRKSWWRCGRTRSYSDVDRPGHSGKRRISVGKKHEDQQYDPENFGEANSRAAQALMSNRASFTPLQMRNLARPKPSTPRPEPPEEGIEPMFLPGMTDDPDSPRNAHGKPKKKELTRGATQSLIDASDVF
eukprot:TRINITY_DN8698_c0_g1_i3.p1 TRINITY_DN8698_c0_g1~~TRINITY_DN8698_c0_g1_i3.p1  ORF type:complete len:746 (+),score=138.22 TRINITY_DN8698_c0_g1_i3:81-2318(+)